VYQGDYRGTPVEPGLHGVVKEILIAFFDLGFIRIRELSQPLVVFSLFGCQFAIDTLDVDLGRIELRDVRAQNLCVQLRQP
jgi:hypothetical protein